MKRLHFLHRLTLTVPWLLVSAMPRLAYAVSSHSIDGHLPAHVLAQPRHAIQTHAGPGLPHVALRLDHHGPLRIVAFGSSSTQGIGASSPAWSYPARLQTELSRLLPQDSVTVANRGIGGQDAVDMATRLPGIVAERPDLVIFQTGTNDPLRGVPLDQFVRLTRQAIASMQGAGIDVMVMEPQLCHVTETHPAAILYRDALRKLSLDAGVPVIRRWDLMQGWLAHDLVTPAQMLAPDGLHMADAGYALLAKEVAHEIIAAAHAHATTAWVEPPEQIFSPAAPSG